MTAERDLSPLNLDDIVELRRPVEIDGDRYFLVPSSELSLRKNKRIELLHERHVEIEADSKSTIDDRYAALVDLVQELFVDPKPERELLEKLSGRKHRALFAAFLEISEEDLDATIAQRTTTKPNRKARRSQKST